jgi:membrane fusion protein (multidrug efflux system)
MHRVPKALLLSAAALFSIVALGGCESGEAETPEHKAKLISSHPVRRDVALTREYVAQIQANRHIEVRALEHGYLEEILVSEGQLVEKGALMFRILPLTYKAELQRARAEAEAAELEYRNTRDLAEANVVSATELALTKANYDKAKAEVDLAAAHFSFTEIRAPFTGIMDRLQVREGSLLEEGEFLTTLSDNSLMWVYFNVPEAAYLDYVDSPKTAAEKTVQLLMANGEPFAHSGQIAVIEADFNNQTGTIPFRADFPNPDGLLRHGQTGNIVMQTPIDDAILVPQKATFEVLDQTYVFVIDADDRVVQRRIQISEELEDLFVVSEGLAESDMILLEGLRNVQDGDEIEYEYEEPRLVLAGLKVPAE